MELILRTNITESPPPPPPPPAGYTSSRGYLTSSFLQSPIKEGEEVLLHSNPITNIPQDAQFSGFNLLLLAPRIIPSPSRSPIPSTGSHPNDPNTTTTTITFDDAVLVTNKGAGGSITTRPLTQDELRYGGLSNGIIDNDDDEWPKVTHGTRLLRDLVSQNVMDETEIVNHLFEILSSVLFFPPTKHIYILTLSFSVGHLPNRSYNVPTSKKPSGSSLLLIILTTTQNHTVHGYLPYY